MLPGPEAVVRICHGMLILTPKPSNLGYDILRHPNAIPIEGVATYGGISRRYQPQVERLPFAVLAVPPIGEGSSYGIPAAPHEDAGVLIESQIMMILNQFGQGIPVQMRVVIQPEIDIRTFHCSGLPGHPHATGPVASSIALKGADRGEPLPNRAPSAIGGAIVHQKNLEVDALRYSFLGEQGRQAGQRCLPAVVAGYEDGQAQR